MAIRFDAAGDRCTWTGIAPTPSSGFTVAFWAYVSVDQNDFSTMVRLHASTGATTVLNVAMDSSGTLPCVFTAGGSSTGPQAVTVGSWARIAVTVTGTTSTVFVALGAAGATQSQVGTVGANAAVSPTSGYTVGGRSAVDSSEWFNGRMANIRFWSTVLTQSEIEAEWASATPVRTSLLFACYAVPDASDLLDSSGNGRHLVAGSSSVTTEDGPPISTAVTGTVSATLPSPTSAADGGVVVAGATAVTLPTATGAVAGAVAVAGVATADLPAIGLAAAGGSLIDGVSSSTLPALDATMNGSTTTSGVAAAALPALDMAASGLTGVGGAVAAMLPTVESQSAGVITTVGAVGLTLPPLTATLQGVVTVPITGTMTAVLPALSMASATLAWPPAVTETAESLIAVDGPHLAPWLTVD